MSEEQQTLDSVPGTPGEAKMVGGGAFKKPVIEKMTPATIKDVTWHKRTEKSKDQKGNEFMPAWLQVTFEVQGITEPVVENYGFRIYQNKDELRGYFGTGKSITGRLRSLVETTFDMPEEATLETFMELLKNKQVILKSEETSFQNEKFTKQVIQQFRI
jgi:hypothetical protein